MDENSFIPWDGSGDEWHSAAAVPDAYKSGWWIDSHAPRVLGPSVDLPHCPINVSQMNDATYADEPFD